MRSGAAVCFRAKNSNPSSPSRPRAKSRTLRRRLAHAQKIEPFGAPLPGPKSRTLGSSLAPGNAWPPVTSVILPRRFGAKVLNVEPSGPSRPLRLKLEPSDALGWPKTGCTQVGQIRLFYKANYKGKRHFWDTQKISEIGIWGGALR